MAIEKIPEIRIVTRFPSLSDRMPGRVYIFEPNFNVAYGGKISLAVEHYKNTVTSGDTSRINNGFNWVNAVMWTKDNGDKMIDFFGYKLDDSDNWRSNTSFIPWVTQEGLLVPLRLDGKTELTCGRATRILGTEEDYRLTTDSLDEYLGVPPQIRGLVTTHADLGEDFHTVRNIWDRR